MPLIDTLYPSRVCHFTADHLRVSVLTRDWIHAHWSGTLQKRASSRPRCVCSTPAAVGVKRTSPCLRGFGPDTSAQSMAVCSQACLRLKTVRSPRARAVPSGLGLSVPVRCLT